MKTGLAKRLPLLLLAFAFVASSGTALADTTNRPYLKTFGSDVMTGAWFSKGNDCATDPASNYQDPAFKSASFGADSHYGGILTYTQSNGVSGGGDSSQYGAFSLGEIDNNQSPGSPLGGFYSSGALAPTSVKALTIANTDNTVPFGGKLEGANRQGNCIPDYYSQRPSSAPALDKPLKNRIKAGQDDGTYGSLDVSKFTGPPLSCSGPVLCLTQNDTTIEAGARLLIYATGDVYIDHNIVYDPAATVDNVPKFALIVKGSIYIDKTVTQLDGMYVAEPGDTSSGAVAADDGIIWTCHDNTTGSTQSLFYPPNCNSPLVVNGSFIAKQINFFRVPGDIGSSSTAEDNLSTVNTCASGSCNVSEVVNFSPGMIMGGSFFDTNTSPNSKVLPIDSIISLPPVF